MPNFEGFVSDLKFTLRLFRKSPGFSLIAIASMALGIGASSAIFSLIYAVLLDPYPYKNADRIIAPTFYDKRGPRGTMDFTIADFEEIRRNSKTLEDIFVADERAMVATGGIPEQVRGDAFSPNAFDFMGVPALRGRTFTAAEITSPQAPPRIAVISYLFWLKHFHGDPAAVGKSLELDHQPWTVIGILPPRFTWNDAEVYVPLAMVRDTHPVHTVLRIRPGIRLEALDAELQAFTERFAKRTPDVYPKDFHFRTQTLNHWLLGKFQGTLLILMSAVGCLLLIACGNVSILLLARASARQKEIAIRVSLGAARGRIVRQLLTESVLLSLAGGVIGIALACIGVPLLVSLMPEYSVPHEAAIRVNPAVVLFTFSIAVGSGILFGMAPALQLARADVRDAMLETGRGFAGSRRAGAARAMLIIAEVALTVILLVGAGVAIRGFSAITRSPLGFNPDNVLTAQMNLPPAAPRDWAARSATFNHVLAAIASTPGVIAASGTFTAMPPHIGFKAPFEILGQSADPTREARIGLIGGDYFEALRIPLLEGRMFTPADVAGARRIGVANTEMVRRYWPSSRAVGNTIRVPELNFHGDPGVLIPGNAAEPIEIIGVVASARNNGLLEPSEPALYVPWTMVLPPSAVFLIRTAGPPAALADAIRERVRNVAPDQPLTRVTTLNQQIADFDTAYPRFSTTLFSIFGAAALLLAVSGLYSVISYVVAQRTHEFGIRMALGARSSNVLGAVVWSTARLMLAGLAIGLVGSLALSGLIANYVTGWNPKDPLAFLAVTGVLFASAILAAWVPARRALSVHPMTALRHD